MKVSVLIPAYNEAATIAATLASIQSVLPQAELVVVDDCSTDNTRAIAAAQGVRVITHSQNRGKAEALTSGLIACSGQVVAMVDADMGDLAGEVAPLVQAVLAEECDMAIALFASSRGGGVGLVRNLAYWGILLLTGSRLQAPLSGQRACTRPLLENCLPRRGGYGLETELTLRALRRGYRVKEIPTGFEHRGQGWKLVGFRHRGRQFFHVLLALCRGGLSWRQH